jgi:hypothetical protein
LLGIIASRTPSSLALVIIPEQANWKWAGIYAVPWPGQVTWTRLVYPDVCDMRSVILNTAADIAFLEVRYTARSNELVAVAVFAEYDWEGVSFEHTDYIAVFRQRGKNSKQAPGGPGQTKFV